MQKEKKKKEGISFSFPSLSEVNVPWNTPATKKRDNTLKSIHNWNVFHNTDPSLHTREYMKPVHLKHVNDKLTDKLTSFKLQKSTIWSVFSVFLCVKPEQIQA